MQPEVSLWAPAAGWRNPDALGGEHGVERSGELPRAVPDQELD